MKHCLTAIALSSLFCVSSFAAKNEDYLKTPDSMVATDLWKDSWVEGKTYEHVAIFDLQMRVKSSADKDATWLSNLMSWGTHGIEGVMSLSGNSRAVTQVLYKDSSGSPVLFRRYGATNLEPIYWFDTDENPIAGLALRAIFSKGTIKKTVDDFITFVGTIPTVIADITGTTGGTGTPSWLIWAQNLSKMVGLGEKIEDSIRDSVKEYGFEPYETKEGQLVYKLVDRSVLKKLYGSVIDKVDTAISCAMAFNGSTYLLIGDANGGLTPKAINEVSVEKIANQLETGIDEEKLDIIKSIDAPVSLEANSVFKREAWGMNAKIFDNQERSVGDVWEVDAEFMNSFLHPDLKGRFEGRVLLKYEGDEETTIERKNWDTEKFFARKIVLIPAEKGLSTNAKYVERNEKGETTFSLSLNASATHLSIFLDKETLLVRQANLNIFDSSVKEGNLPKSIWTGGLSLNGAATCNVDYFCRSVE